jgi:phenol hydroxylase P4 protein
MVNPWAASDPEFDPAVVHDWQLFDQPLNGADDKSLAELGIGHKALLTFSI